jgi:hypothetical protein
MPRNATKDTVPLFVEISTALDRRLRERCESTGAKLADEVRLALTRHLDWPPPPPVPELSPMLPDAAVPSRAAKKRKKG